MNRLPPTLKYRPHLSPRHLFYRGAMGLLFVSFILFSTSVAFAVAPPPPTLVTPLPGEVSPLPFPSFLWNEAAYPHRPRSMDSSYRIQISSDGDFKKILADDQVPIPRYVPHVPLNGKLFVRVKESRDSETGPWSAVTAFSVAPPERTIEIPPDADWPAAQSLIGSAISSGAGLKILLAPKALYKWDADGAAFILKGISNLIIDGRGSKILFKKHNTGLASVERSATLMIANLMVDWEDLPHVAARIDAVETDSLLTTPLPGYPGLDAPYLPDAWSFAVLLDPLAPGRLKTGISYILSLDPKRIERVGKQVRVGLRDLGQRPSYAVGDTVVEFARAKGKSLVNMANCSNLVMWQIESHGTSGGHYLMIEGTDLKVLGCRELIGEGRVFGGNADGVHTRANPLGPWVEGCTIEGLGDDGVAIYSKAVYIQSMPKNDTLILGPDFFNLQVGDEINIWNPREGEVRAQGLAIKSVTPVAGGAFQVSIDPALSFSPETRFAGISNDQVFNRTRNNGMFMIRSNTIRSIRRYGTVIRGVNGVVDGNRYEGCSSSAIMVRNEPAFWRNGLFSWGLLIRSNSISDTGFDATAADTGSITIQLEALGSQPVLSRVQSNMRVVGNRIQNWRGAALELESATQIEFAGNAIGPRASDPDPETSRFPISIQRSRNIILTGNTFKDSQPWDGVVHQFESQISSNGNSVQVAFRKPDTSRFIHPGDPDFIEEGAWSKSGVAGGLGRPTRYTSAVGGSAFYRVPPGRQTVSIYLVKRSGNDNAAELRITHQGGEEKRVIDLSDGNPTWLELGSFTFGSGQGIRLVKVKPEGFLRASGLKLKPVE